MWLNPLLLQFPRTVFQSLSFYSYLPLCLKPDRNIPCLETKTNKILFSASSHKTTKCYFFLLLPLYKEFLCFGFLFSTLPIPSFLNGNITSVCLQDHELQKGWQYILFMALCNMPRQTVNIHWVNVCHHPPWNCLHIGKQWTSCNYQNAFYLFI